MSRVEPMFSPRGPESAPVRHPSQIPLRPARFLIACSRSTRSHALLHLWPTIFRLRILPCSGKGHSQIAGREELNAVCRGTVARAGLEDGLVDSIGVNDTRGYESQLCLCGPRHGPSLTEQSSATIAEHLDPPVTPHVVFSAVLNSITIYDCAADASFAPYDRARSQSAASCRHNDRGPC